jgi:hypothetical protein
VRGENLARHLERTHPGGGGEAPWPSRLRVEPGRITVRGRLGLTRRRVTLPAAAEIGGMSKGRPSAGMTSYADEFNVPHDRVPDGVYLRLTNGGSVTIACRTGTGVRRHWTGWTPGRRRQHAQIRLDAPAFVRLQYALAEQGVLTPRDAPAS